MQRRNLLKGAAAGLAMGALPTAQAADLPKLRWRLASSFPKNLDTIFGGALRMAERVGQLTGGRFQIRVHAPKEIVEPLQVFDAVQQGTVECGHSAGYYYVGKNLAFAFDTALPFGLTARQQSSWIYSAGGMALLRELFAGYNVVNFPGGNTGTQMGGWFRKPIKSVGDLKGLKMRIPGLGGQIMQRLGVVPQTIGGGDIYPALERGTIDATEWVGPYDDEKLGFHKAAKNYYYPGWWEGGAQLSFYVNLKQWQSLPKPYQQAFEVAAAETSLLMLADYDAKNPLAVARLEQRGVKFRPFPKDIMDEAQRIAFAMYAEEAAKNPAFAKIYAEWNKFRRASNRWLALAENTYANFAFAK